MVEHGVADISCGLIMKNSYLYQVGKVVYVLYGRVADATIGEKNKLSLVRQIFTHM